VLAGGLSPVIAASLAASSGNLVPVGLYMVVLGLLSVISVVGASRHTASRVFSSVAG
jgi:hypothetical protein